MLEESVAPDRVAIPHSKSSFEGVIADILEQPFADPELVAHLTAAVTRLTESSDADRPFLTVLLRTQGKRIEPLKDALLCLAAQTDEDFEVIVLDHNSDAPEQVGEIVQSQPGRFAPRVRVVEVSGGGRATPLNIGISEARGLYIAVFDDDDLVMANWVEEFHRASRTGSRRILRAVSSTQQVASVKWPTGQAGFRTSSRPIAEYDSEFTVFEHFRQNRTPFMSIAFPAALFSKFGYRFDETLAVCEDWDMIIRASLVCGVSDVDALTSIYRRWQFGASSYSDHSSAVWREAESRVLDKVDNRPIVLPPGSARTIRRLIEDQGAQTALQALLSSRSWRYAKPLRGALRIAAYGRRIVASARRKA